MLPLNHYQRYPNLNHHHDTNPDATHSPLHSLSRDLTQVNKSDIRKPSIGSQETLVFEVELRQAENDFESAADLVARGNVLKVHHNWPSSSAPILNLII